MKWLLRIGLTATAVAAIAAGALVLLPAETVARLAAERFEAETGRALAVEGPVRAVLWPHPGVRAEGIALADAAWGGPDPMLTAEAVEFGLDLGALWEGRIAIRALSVEGAAVTLRRRADGTGNWTLGGEGGAVPDLSIARATMRNATVTFEDGAAGRSWTLEAVDLEAAMPSLDGPAAVAASALLGGRAVSVEAHVDALRPFAGGALTPVAAVVRSGRSALALEGRADLDPASFQGTLRLDSEDGLAALEPLGIAPPDLPEGLGRDALALAAQATLAPGGSVHLRDMTLTLDGNVVTGGVDVTPGVERPYVTASLSAEALRFPVAAPEAGDAGWSTAPLDASALFAADGEVTLMAGPVTLGDARLDRVAAVVAADRGRAVATLQPLRAWGGTVTGSVVVNARGRLSARAVLDAEGIAVDPALGALGARGLVGAANGSVNLLAVGDDMDALMRSLEGEVALRVDRGALVGVDLGAMVRQLDADATAPDLRTAFEGLDARFAVAGGVARGDDLLAHAPPLAADGAGAVDIGARTLDYRLMLRPEHGDGPVVPIEITGPWAAPKLRPDLEWIARREIETRAKAEAARRAERAAREKLAAELEVEASALGSQAAIEAAIRDRVGAQLLEVLGER